MRAYVTILDGDDGLLPFFVRHYRRLGATLFPIVAYGDARDSRRAAETIQAEGGQPQVLGVFASATFSARHREAFIASVHPAGEWSFFCDLDEFAELSPAQVRQATAGTRPYIPGRWVDRVAPGGRLAAVQPLAPLESQYPLSGRLRSIWGMGDAVYVLSPRAPLSHHPNTCPWGRGLWPQPCIRVHHFKWQANVVRRLEARLERIRRAGKQQTGWGHRVRRMLAHLHEHDGIDRSLLEQAGNVLSI